MKFTLPISGGYVASWGLWEAVREIWQNAMDAADEDPDCAVLLSHKDGLLAIQTSRGSLDKSTLVLGVTSKKSRPEQRGKFGEGYKLALLVLARIGLPVMIYTGGEVWTARLEYDENFTCNVLNVYTGPAEENDGVRFEIHGVTDVQWAQIQGNMRLPADEGNVILEQPDQIGRIYVGGLYVTTAKDLKCGYSFKAGEISLDRDRGMVSGFDLAYKTSQMWTERGGERATQLLKEQARDVEYVESHAAPASPISLSVLAGFHESYGHYAVPVSNQEEIERATAAGVKWALVPEPVKNVLRLVKSWFIPTTKSPAELLREFKKKYQWRMQSDMAHDLEEILNILEPKAKEAE
jgi:hypothetical protein